MAALKIEKDSDEWNIHQEYWKLHKDFGDPEDNDAYWNTLDGEITRWTNKYKGTDYEEMVRMIAVGMLGLLDGKLRRKKNDPHTL